MIGILVILVSVKATLASTNTVTFVTTAITNAFEN